MTPPSRRAVRIRAVVVTLVLAGLALAGGYQAFRMLRSLREPTERTATAPPRTVVRALRAERGEHRETLRGYGRARALRRTPVPAEVAGVVVGLSPKLEAGNRVGTDEVLVTLDARDFEREVERLQAQVAQHEAAKRRNATNRAALKERREEAREELRTARAELARLRGLRATGSVSETELDAQVRLSSQTSRVLIQIQQEIDGAADEDDRLDALITGAQAALARARLDLGRTKVRAPWPGTVVTRAVDEGQRVTPGTELFGLVDLSRVEVPVALGASRFDEVAVGRRAVVRLTEGGPVVWRGEVARVAPTVDPLDRTFFAYLEIGSAGGRAPVPPGAFVLAEIEGRAYEDVVVVPRTAFVADVVYVAVPAPDASGEAVVEERRPTVRRFLPDVALVEQGIEPGELVVTTNVDEVADGRRVRVSLESAADGQAGNGR